MIVGGLPQAFERLESCSRMTGARPKVGSSRIRSFGLHHQRARNRQHLLLAAGQRPGRLFLTLPQDREQLEQPTDPFFRSRLPAIAGRQDRGFLAPSCR